MYPTEQTEVGPVRETEIGRLIEEIEGDSRLLQEIIDNLINRTSSVRPQRLEKLANPNPSGIRLTSTPRPPVQTPLGTRLDSINQRLRQIRTDAENAVNDIEL